MSSRIAELNDLLRRTLRGGRVMMTNSVAGLSCETQAAILRAVMSFDDFNADNDPYGEHDCARFVVGDYVCLFKIDYYDLDMQCRAEDPSDLARTTRVLTIMLAGDY